MTSQQIGGLVGGLGGLFGGNTDDTSQLKWYQNFLSTLLNTGTDAKQFGQDIFLGAKDDLFSRLMPFLNNTGAGSEQLRQNATGLFNDSLNGSSAYNPLNYLMQNPTQFGMNPQMASMINQSGALGLTQQGMGDLANQVFQGGGWTQQGQNIFDNLDKFMAGNGANAQMGNLAQQVIAGGGANPYSNFLTDAGMGSINRGGSTGQSNALMNYGQQGLQSGGMTPWDQLALQAAQQGLATQGFNQNSNALSQTGQGLLGSGGRNADNSFLASRGRDILGRNPLLSMDEVTTAAADKAGSLFANNSEQNYRQAMNRGGGPAFRSGLQNQAVQENEDDMLRGVSEAVNQARLGQQGLQLQNFGQGADLMNSGLSNILQNLNTGGSLTSSGENAALQRMLGLTGLGTDSSNRAINAQQLYSQMLNNSGQLSNQNMATLGGLGMEGLNAANNKLNSGINLFGQTQGNQLQALQQYLANLSNTNNYALGAGQLANNTYNNTQNTFSNLFNNSLAADTFGQNRLNNSYSQFQNNLNNAAGFTNNQQQNFLSGLGQVGNYMNQGFNTYNNALGGLMGLFGGYNTSNSRGSNAIGNAIGGGLNAPITAAGS